MAVEYINRKGDKYYLHKGKTKTGKDSYFFPMKKDGALVDSTPSGYEVYENPNARVFLRKIIPQIITHEEAFIVNRMNALIYYYKPRTMPSQAWL